VTSTTEKTHAVLIGIETYAIGADWDLTGPALDACRVGHWLVDRGVPPANITLLVAPLRANDAEVQRLAGEVGVRPADHTAIREALTTSLYYAKSDLLVIYWGGHGVFNVDGSRRLFYAEASRRDKRNIDLTSLLTALRSNLYASHPCQLILVDACTTLVGTRNWGASLPVERLAAGEPTAGQVQNTLLAAGVGQIAVNDTVQRTGLFSNVALGALAAMPNGEWPPDPIRLRDSVNTEFQNLRERGRTNQVPTHVWFQSGGEEGHLLFTTRVEETRASAAAVGQLLLTARQAARLHAVLDGLAVPESLALLYEDATRKVLGLPRCPDDIWAAVEVLRTAHSARPLFEFVVRLADKADPATRQQLWTWLRHTAPPEDLHELATLNSMLRRTTFLIRVNETMLGPGYDVTIWSYSGGEGCQVLASDTPMTWRQVAAHLSDILRDIADIGGLVPVFEFELPLSLVQHPVETLPADLGDGKHTIGDYCPVVVRPTEQLVGAADLESWHQRWRQLQSDGDRYRDQSVIVLPAVVRDRPSEQWQDVLCAGIYGLRDQSTGLLGPALAATTAAGIPALLWHRGTPARADDESALSGILRGHALRNLPDLIHQLRRNAQHPQAPLDHPGRSVVLLWHDPNHLPPTTRWTAPIREGTR